MFILFFTFCFNVDEEQKEKYDVLNKEKKRFLIKDVEFDKYKYGENTVETCLKVVIKMFTNGRISIIIREEIMISNTFLNLFDI